MVLMMVISTMVILPLTASAETGDITAVKPEGYGDGGAIGQSADNPYIISEPGHLVYLGQSELKSGYFALANDIDMTGVTNFLAIKCPSDSSSYVFDGQGYAIQNLTVQDGFATSSSIWVGGLFGMTRGYVTIKNLKMESLTVDNTWTDSNNTEIGGLVGEAQSQALTIDNVTIDGNSAITCNRSAATMVGGFIGQVTKGVVTITNSVCDAAVTAFVNYDSTYGGGFIGKHGAATTLTFENCTKGGGETKGRYAGGFVGVSSATDNVFKNCTVNANVSQNGTNKAVGGLIAYADSSSNVTAENCVIEKVSLYGPSPKSGGILGWGNGIGTITVTNCVNKARVASDAAYGGTHGGFIGRLDKPNGVTMIRCINTGIIGCAASSNSFTAGGFIGLLYGNQSTKKTIKMEYCLNTGEIHSSGSVGGMIGNTNDGEGTRFGGTFDYDFDYCGNTGALTTYLLASGGQPGGGYAGHVGAGGLVGAVYDRQATEATTFTADNCFNTGAMAHDTKYEDFGGFGGMVGVIAYRDVTGHTVDFNNCFVTSEASSETGYEFDDFYGTEFIWGSACQTITVADTCKTGDDAAAGIATVEKAIFADLLDMSTAGQKLSVRMRVTDDFGFMAILQKTARAQAFSDLGICFSTGEITDVNAEGVKKVAGAAYNDADSNVFQAAYTDLTVATLGTKVYFAAYVTFNGATYLASDVRSINCLDIVAELRDGMLGNAVITKNPYEMVLYSEMVTYYNMYQEYIGAEDEVIIPPIASSELLTGIPAFHATPTKTMDTGENCKVVIFNDSKVANFTDYCTALEAAGFTKYSESTFHGGEMENAGAEDYYKAYFTSSFDSDFSANNYFATYVSEDRTIDLAFHEYDNIMYVSVSPTRGGLTLPNNQEVAVDNPLPITITQIGTGDLHDEGDMCYVIRLADGSFIVYDTGLSYESRGYVADEIVKVMRKQAADPENIVISAFIMTHPHSDHTTGFVQFANRYAGNTGIKVKQVVFNFPDDSQIDSAHVKSTYTTWYLTQMALKKLGPDVELVKPRSGNVLHYAGVKFNVLYTQEDYLSLRDVFWYENSDGTYTDTANASTLVMQMVTIMEDGSDGMKVLFGGDHYADQCQGQLKYRYGTFLESYVVTLLHHGQGGGAEDNSAMSEHVGFISMGGYYTGWKYSIYAMAIKPKVVLWPNTWAKINSTDPTQDDAPRNLYFTKTGSNMNQDFTAGKDALSSTPNNKGVYGYFVADDGIQILTINGADSVSVTTYETRAEYYSAN